MASSLKLEKEAFFFPIENGLYEVKAGLNKFVSGQDKVFLIDENYEEYIQAKQEALQESRGKYYCSLNELSLQDQKVLLNYFLDKLREEYPLFFEFQYEKESLFFENKILNQKYQFPISENKIDFGPFSDFFDFISSQVQCDLALHFVDLKNQKEHLERIHLCFPNHWSAEGKIGKSFLDIHAPVPHFDSIAKRKWQILGAMLSKGPFVRFAWGLSTDQRLNHHPLHPKKIKAEEWAGRSFQPENPKLFLRVERQVLIPFEAQKTSAFSIRTFHYDVTTLSELQKQDLASAIRSMSEASFKYKGLVNDQEKILKFLK